MLVLTNENIRFSLIIVGLGLEVHENPLIKTPRITRVLTYRFLSVQ